ncbi:hypothetical protein [uncultured Kordia sp.]|uniref:EF-Tu C-terminal domain-related protein n=1 Tax=uncultured Kordia sp. TaxID=507699 RepID=UPI00260AFF48|nr:hypothetical protein [uncultured Kordia sp.]
MEEKQFSPDFIAQVHYITTEEGGRSTPASSGYRPQIKFPFSKQMISGMQNFIGKDTVYPGETIVVEIIMLSPQFFEKQLKTRMHFELREGYRIVATGIVLKIVNDTLRE